MKITLAAIVGNEEAVIERFVRSFAPAVDRIVLVRGAGHPKYGPGDNTLIIAENVCKSLGKPLTIGGTIYAQSDFRHTDHFGGARQRAWELANQPSTDFILWADADDILANGAAESIRAAAEDGQHDVYIMPYHVRGDKQIVHRERMVKTGIGSYWKYAIHEQLAFPQDVTYRVIKDAVFIHAPLSQKTGSHERNVAILMSELEDAPRNLFYLAQQHFQSGDENKFKRWANAALAMPGLGDIERYETLLNLAQTNGTDSRKLAAEAFAMMPDRREALALLTNYALIDGDNQKALELASRMIKTPKPSVTYWSQNNEWYGWKADELYMQCLRLNGKQTDAELWQEHRQNLQRHTFSIIHATLGRPDKALAIREMWLSRANHPENVEYIFGLHSFDEKSVRMLRGFKHTITDKKGAAINYDTAAGISTGTIIIQGQDDCYPPQGWDDALLEIVATPFHPVFVATNDGHRTDLLSVNTIMTRAYMEIKARRDPGENGFFHTGYTTVFPDTENSFRALQDAKTGICRHVHAPQFLLYHDHPFYNPGVPMDETYEWENHPDNYNQGFELFKKRNPDADPSSFQIELEKANTELEKMEVMA